MNTTIRGLVAACASVVAAASLAVALPAASAGAAPVDAFYTPPASVPDAPGAILKSRPSSIVLQIPASPRPFPGAARTVMYASKLQDGTPVATTGTFVQPFAPWRGRGAQPTVVLASGTIGQGDQCAPSKQFPTGVRQVNGGTALNYEIPNAVALLLNGYRVFMPDYIGLGTPGLHTYVNRLEQGHAVLDGLRAALSLSNAPKNAPVGIWGYSQGGAASASASELAATYAPELNVRGTYTGAGPADLVRVFDRPDDTTIASVVGYTVSGLAARYPQLQPLIDREVTPYGKSVLQRLTTTCIGDTIKVTNGQSTKAWTKSGQQLIVALSKYPEFRKALDDQRIGRLTPNAPVLVDTGINDDVIPHGQVVTMAQEWRSRGVSVRLISDPTPAIMPGSAINHALPYVFSTVPALQFLQNRFNS